LRDLLIISKTLLLTKSGDKFGDAHMDTVMSEKEEEEVLCLLLKETTSLIYTLLLSLKESSSMESSAMGYERRGVASIPSYLRDRFKTSPTMTVKIV
jgi:hypothetical protein